MRPDQHKALVEIHSAIASISNKEELFKVIIDKIKPVIGFDDESVVVAYDDTGNYYSLFETEDQKYMNEFFKTQCGLDAVGNDSLVCEIADLKSPALFNIKDMLRKYPGHPKLELSKANGYVQAFMGPLKFQGETLGTFIVHAKDEKFNYEDFEMFSAVTDLLALAVRNILDLQEIRHQKLEKEVLLNIGETIASMRDKEELMDVIHEQLQPIFGGSEISTNLCLYRPEIECAELYLTTISQEMQEEVKEATGLSPIFPAKDNIMEKIMTSKNPMIIHPDDLKGDPNNRPMYDGMVHMGVKEAMSGPLIINGKSIGSLHLHSKSEGHFTERMQHLFKGICDLMAIGVSNLLAKEEIEKLNSQLQEEKEYLMEEVNFNYNYEEMIGASQSMRDVYKLTSQVAVTDSTVLILGETGTGKELFARAIHNLSNRKDKPLIKINCAALPKELVESELFGHEKGSFTGALQQKIGKFELAQDGTIFFDEIGELPHEMQSKLLRVLQEREFERVGGNQTIQSDVRIIAASNRNLDNLVNTGEFRADLFYRLNVFSINLPPLSERKEDIPLLANHFLIQYAQRVGKNIKSISQQSLKELEVYPWPGNVRELEHVIERSVILCTGSVLKVHLDKKLAKSSGSNDDFRVKTLQESERELILNTLKICNGRIRGDGGASELLDIKPSTLEFRMKKLGITREHILVA